LLKHFKKKLCLIQKINHYKSLLHTKLLKLFKKKLCLMSFIEPFNFIVPYNFTNETISLSEFRRRQKTI